MNTIGLKGTGYDRELDIIKETEKAYLCKDELNREYWLPKTAFDDTGKLLDWGRKMLKEKFQNYEYKNV